MLENITLSIGRRVYARAGASVCVCGCVRLLRCASPQVCVALALRWLLKCALRVYGAYMRV